MTLALLCTRGVLITHVLPVAILLVCFTIFSLYTVLVKKALSSGTSPIVLAFVRECLATCVLLPVAYISQRRKPASQRQMLPRVEDIGLFVALGACMVYGVQVMSALALNQLSANTYALLAPSVPVFTLAIALLTRYEPFNRREWLSWLKVLSVLVTTAGALIIALGAQASANAAGSASKNAVLGMVLLLVNKLCVSSYPVLEKRMLKSYDPLVIVAWGYATGSVLTLMAVIPCATEPGVWHITRDGWIAIAYASVLTSALNYALMIWVNKRTGPVLVMSMYALQSILTPLLSYAILGAPLSSGDLGGGSVIVGGLALLLFTRWWESGGKAAAAAAAGASAHAQLRDDDSPPGGASGGGAGTGAAADDGSSKAAGGDDTSPVAGGAAAASAPPGLRATSRAADAAGDSWDALGSPRSLEEAALELPVLPLHSRHGQHQQQQQLQQQLHHAQMHEQAGLARALEGRIAAATPAAAGEGQFITGDEPGWSAHHAGHPLSGSSSGGSSSGPRPHGHDARGGAAAPAPAPAPAPAQEGWDAGLAAVAATSGDPGAAAFYTASAAASAGAAAASGWGGEAETGDAASSAPQFGGSAGASAARMHAQGGAHHADDVEWR